MMRYGEAMRLVPQTRRDKQPLRISRKNNIAALIVGYDDFHLLRQPYDRYVFHSNFPEHGTGRPKLRNPPIADEQIGFRRF